MMMNASKREDSPKRPAAIFCFILLKRRGPALFAASTALIYLGALASFFVGRARDEYNIVPTSTNHGDGRRLRQSGGTNGNGGASDGAYSATIPLDSGLCPDMVRAGSSGNGGWWLCGSETAINNAGVGGMPPNPYDQGRRCIVYSFGVGKNLSFDRYLSQQRGCEVHSFDPGLANLKGKKGYENYDWNSRGQGGSAALHPYGIGYDDKTYAPGRAPFRWPGISYLSKGNKKVWELLKLETIMQRLRTEVITILKIDVEGMEWDIMRDLTESEWDELLMELHFPPGEYRLSKAYDGSLEVLRQPHFTLFYRKRPAMNVSGPIDRIGLLKMLNMVADMYHWELIDAQRVHIYFRRKAPKQNSKLFVTDDMIPRAPSPDDEVA